MDTKTFIKLILQKKRLFAIVGMISLAIGIIISLSIPKQYTAKVMLAPETSQSSSQLGNLSSLASSLGINTDMTSTDAISPQLYPHLFNSTKFMVDLCQIHVTSIDKKINTTLFDYYKKEQVKPWWSHLSPKEWLSKDKKSYDKNFNSFQLTKEQTDVISDIKDMLSCSVDRESNIITIKAIAQDPLISAIIVDSASILLKEYITNYRTSKARNDLKYTQKLFTDAKAQYIRSQERYAAYSDANEDVVLESFRAKQDEMENEMQLRYNIYTQVVQQLQVAKAKLQERTPVYAVIEPATVPVRASAPKKIIISLICLLIGLFCTTAYVVIKKQ